MCENGPGEFVEPSTIGLKDSRLIYQVFINQSLAVFVHLNCAENASKRWLITAGGAQIGHNIICIYS